jgi:ribosomal protein S18 acetylase RimI-like enzyme
MMEINIRPATVADAEAIARVHIAAWRESYAELMPAGVLAGLDADEWTGRWRENLSDPDPATSTFLAIDETGRPAGFGHCRRQRSEKLLPLGFSGEITSLYLLRHIQRRAVGQRLLGEMARHLIAHGCDSAAVWAFRDATQARAFYEAQGALPTGIAGVWEIYGMVLPDVAYGWRRLSGLVSAGSS